MHYTCNSSKDIMWRKSLLMRYQKEYKIYAGNMTGGCTGGWVGEWMICSYVQGADQSRI